MTTERSESPLVISRRGFLGFLAAAPVVAMAKTKLWVPSDEIVSLPQRMVAGIVAPGQLIHGYFAEPDELRGAMAVYAEEMATITGPVLFLNDGRRHRGIGRFLWVGSRPELERHARAKVIGAFESGIEMQKWLM